MSNWPLWTKILLIGGVIFACVVMCCCLVFAGLMIYSSQVSPNGDNTSTPWFDFELPTDAEPTVEIPADAFPTPSTINPGESTPAAITPADGAAWETLKTMEDTIIPVNDLRELAQRLGGKGEIPLSVPAPAREAKVGDVQKFWVGNMDTDENFQVEATLRVKGEHVTFWVENGVDYSLRDVQALVSAFDEKIYPTNRNFFGSENTPGVDSEDRLYILYASNIGSSVAGYFSSADAVHPLAHPYSNAKEMFVMSADNAPLEDDYTFGVLAHEFQHMIHWNMDRNEESWLNEGFSELASYLNAYDPGNAPYSFAAEPDLQLNYWPDFGESYAHYGSSYLFVSYILDQFGNDLTQALVKDDANGMDSLDQVLAENNIRNPETGEIMTADEVYADWAAANFLNDPAVADGQFGYRGGTDVPSFYPEETQSTCPLNWQASHVSQYGTDYVEFTCEGSYTLQFQGVSEVGLLPEDAYSGDYTFWSNRGDESDMTMTREFDFSAVRGEINLEYQVWFELEEGWDYAYLVVSEDGGETWDILKTGLGTDYNPQGNAYGWGYTGSSNGWNREVVDLSAYAGKKIQIRFEYITDAAVNLDGLMVDDLRVEAVGYESDLEVDAGGWQGEGFVRIQNRLPQTFALSVITIGANPSVQTYLLTDTPQISIPIVINGSDSVVLAISGTTRFTTQPAIYRYQVSEP